MSPLVQTSLAALALTAACGERIEQRVLHRSACEVCHQPLNGAGEAEGIEEAHPWHPLSCTDCHGGNAFVCNGRLDQSGDELRCEGEWIYDQERSHPDPAGSPEFLRDLLPGQLDAVDPDWLRFVNPADLRVVPETCGRCHTSEAAAVRRSAHALAPGELAVARFRAGKQDSPVPRFGAATMVDSGSGNAQRCTAAVSVAQFDPLPVLVGSDDPLTAPTLANAQDQLLVKECMGCHLGSFGANDAPGNYRSSGCAACHVAYAEDGRSVSGDPWIDKTTPPHPVQHRLSSAVPTSTCSSCHWAGARIGLSFQGMRDPAGVGWEREGIETLERRLHGKPAGHYVVDEDAGNDFDETPPDVHFEAGMDCVDCHTRIDLHGDGHIYADAACVVRTACEDCHGSVREAARPGGRHRNLIADDDGTLYLTTKRSGLTLRVPQVVDSLDPASPHFSARAAALKGLTVDDFSHADALECSTCHSAWIPTCYGCHVEVDLTRSGPYQTTAATTPGVSDWTPLGVQTNDMVLMRGPRGKLALSTPAGRMLMTLLQPGTDGEPVPVFERVPRGFGQRALDPHTTRRVSQFMACDRCHSTGSAEDPDNRALLDLTHGFGSERFVVDGRRLDAVIDRNGTALVVVGHPEPEPSAPLRLEEIGRMRAVVVPADAPWSTDIPEGADADPSWPDGSSFRAGGP